MTPQAGTAQAINLRSAELFNAQIARERTRVSYLFAWLLGFQWLAVMATAIWRSPRTWSGAESSIHPHLWMAFVLGILFSSVPMFLASTRPRESSTRGAVAIGQMLMGSLLIHISGGRIENHFHVFVSLAFLAFYRDIRVIIVATLVVTIDHVFRGLWFPQSIYGLASPQSWLSFEHALWVVFEDVILIAACRAGTCQTRAVASRQAELEVSNQLVEARVQERTLQVRRGQTALSESEKRYRTLFEDSPAGLYRVTMDGRVILANSCFLNMTGYSRVEEMQTVRLDAGDVPLESLLAPTSLANRSELLHFESVWPRKDGSALRVSGTVRAFYDSQGAPLHLDGSVEDVTERSRMEELERDRNSVLEMISQNRTLSEVIEQIKMLMGRQIPEGRCDIQLSPDAVGNPGTWTVQLVSSEGSNIGTLSVQLPQVREPQGYQKNALDAASRLAIMAVDHQRLYQKLQFQASHDSLTSLPSRVLLETQMEDAIEHARLTQAYLGVVWVDLDRFKQINDTLGHQVGDGLLQAVAKRLNALLRPTEIIARIGNDEFAIIVTGAGPASLTERHAKQLVNAFDQPFFVGPHSVSITASLGVSVYPAHGDTAGELLANADNAMHRAKSAGGNCYVCFSPEMAQGLLRRKNLETQMRTALQNGEFELYYQPQVSLATADCRAIMGVEALLRWSNPTLGRVSPAEFIPVAEESGRILAIGNWVLNEACRQSVAWCRAGFPPVRIAVNVSGLQFARPDFVSNVEAALAKTGVNPGLLELELTETSLMQNLGESDTKMRRLSDLGINVAIDDFGTGYCSLSYLQGLSATTLKIDQSFVRRISAESSAGVAILQAIVDMARSLELKVVAEGVETEYQFSVLEKIGCDLAQGYLISMPLPRQALEDLVLSNESSRALYALAQSLSESEDENIVPTYPSLELT